MKKSKIITIATIIVLCLLGLVAAIGVIVGVTTHDEPNYIGDNIRWQSIPINVSCVGYTEEDRNKCSVVPGTIIEINQRLGFEIYKYSSEPLREVQVVMGYPEIVGNDRHFSGEAVRFFQGHIMLGCEIHIMNIANSQMLFLTTEHELGHCLDLAHDPFESSIMYPVIPSSTSFGQFPPRISDDDRRALRERYMQGSSESAFGLSSEALYWMTQQWTMQ